MKNSILSDIEYLKGIINSVKYNRHGKFDKATIDVSLYYTLTIAKSIRASYSSMNATIALDYIRQVNDELRDYRMRAEITRRLDDIERLLEL